VLNTLVKHQQQIPAIVGGFDLRKSLQTSNVLRKLLIWAVALPLCVIPISNASAIKGGLLAVGDSRVVALIVGQTNNRASCSGALLTPKIVVSAAHCLGNEGMTYSNEIYNPTNLWVAQPGVDLNLDDVNKRVKVAQVVLTNGYSNIFDVENKTFLVQKDDIAFLFLSGPLIENYTVQIATEQDIQQIKSQQITFTHFGYGLQDKNLMDGKPYTMQLKSFNKGASRFAYSPASEQKTVSSQDFDSKTICPGDSGGPWYAEIGGVQKIVAVTYGSKGCKDDPTSGTLGTAIAPYLTLLNSYSDIAFETKLREIVSLDIQATVLNPRRGWSAWINSFEYVKGPNPLRADKATTVRMKGVCTSLGRNIQAMKNTGSNGVKYPNGMRYVTPKWKCVKGVFTGVIDVSGNTKMDIYEEPKNRVGTEITFKVGQKIVPTELYEPVLY
jgi:hypothetical protein